MLYLTAVFLPFLILIILGPGLIRGLEYLNFGQQIRGEGPSSHQKKKGIPTMGGILIVFALLISSFIFLDLGTEVIWALITTLGMGLIGFLDDIIKIRSKRSLGLRAREKLVGQILVGLLLGIYVVFYSGMGKSILIPFTGWVINPGYWLIPFIVFIVVGFTNAVNLTDGLDGLAAGVTFIVCTALAVLCSALGYKELALYALIVSGACLGFIWFNSHPAQVFMGDVGSLALGGAVSALAVLSGTEFFLVIIGGIYVAEALSVMIQVSYFKISGGKRIFRMTPLHHHYELAGLEEAKIVSRFWISSIILAILGLLSFFIIS
ncbi:MAG: phospho-N-acetylmuramoyl-pentapeptide-transferase [Halanaerobiaceae bacterium]|nr:phospho-N-acetylmuramoyl-pentapeptide-transferase [Halanaerobiaceae bacterium]